MAHAGIVAGCTSVREAVIVGFGNTLRGDDGLGPYIVERLQDMPVPRGMAVRTIVLPQLDVAMIPEVCEADLVILVDARADGSEDLVSVSRVEAPAGLSNKPHTSHAIGASDLLHILREWYGTVPVCYAVMPKGYDFSINESVSQEARAAAIEARGQIESILTAFVAQTGA